MGTFENQESMVLFFLQLHEIPQRYKLEKMTKLFSSCQASLPKLPEQNS